MTKWVAFLSDGTIAAEGHDQWKEIPGESLPWRRLCEYLQKEKLFITCMGVLNSANRPFIPKPILRSEDLDPLFFSIQYDLEVDGIMSGATVKTTLRLSSHYENKYSESWFIDTTTGEVINSITEIGFDPMCPSPNRLTINA